MIEAKEVSREVNEKDVTDIYAEYGGAMKNLQKLLLAAVSELENSGVKVENARFVVERDNIIIRINDIYLFHEEKLWTKKVETDG